MPLVPTTSRRLCTLAVAAVTILAGAVVSLPRPAYATSPSDHVLFWNGVLRRTFRQIPGPPGSHTRAGALVHTAIYDAANSALCTASAGQCIGEAYLTKLTPTGALPDVGTAIDYAAYTTLNSLKAVYPSLTFDADLATAQSSIPDSPSRTAGRTLGTQVGQAAVDNRAGDGFPDTSTYTASTQPGFWRPTGSGPAGTPSWGLVRPWALSSGSQFRPVGPAGFTSIPALLPSTAYADNVNEVKAKGRATGSTRTADETQRAFFWANDLDGTYKPPGQLFAHTEIVSQRAHLSQAGNARLFALVAIGMADAAVAAWDAKYLTAVDLWRPETAIQLADSDGNANTAQDTSWLPLSVNTQGVRFSPPFPAYISGHATLAGAWAATMNAFFHTDTFFYDGTTDDPNAVGVTRFFGGFNQAAREDAESRIFLGVHFRFDSDDGIATGTSVGNHAAGTRVRPPAGAYTFAGFYNNSTFIGTFYFQVAGPVSLGLEFGLTTASGTPLSDLNAVVGYWVEGGTTGTLSFNSTTGRYRIPVSIGQFCTLHNVRVLLRDGTSHVLTVECDAT
jgi:hypothetical protein